MKVLLIDVDSKIPNLALMKISAWHKALGDSVSFNEPEPGMIYGSIIFKKNRHSADGWGYLYPSAKEIHVGGSGVDLRRELPPEIESCAPDYSLYPGMDYSMGFTSRGCVRKCYFCVVPEKEGRYRRWHHPEQWVRHKKAKLLDNNWYADRDWFFETSDWLIRNDIAIDVTQGMDIRLLTEEMAQQIKRLKWFERIHFAFDDESYQEKVISGISILKEAGIDTRNKVMFLVYCHDDSQYSSALRRARILKKAGTSPFIMWNCDNPNRSPRIKRLIRIVNRPAILWTPGALEALPD